MVTNPQSLIPSSGLVSSVIKLAEKKKQEQADCKAKGGKWVNGSCVMPVSVPTPNSPEFSQTRTGYGNLNINGKTFVGIDKAEATGLIENYQQKQQPFQGIPAFDTSRQAAITEQQALLNAQSLPAPDSVSLTPQRNAGQAWIEKNIPILGPIAASIADSFIGKNKVKTGVEGAGAIVEATGATRAPFGIGSWIAGFTNAPKESAKKLAKQIPDIRKDITSSITKATNSQDALNNLNKFENELSSLESEIAKNVARSAELRSNPEDIDEIQRNIYSVRNLIYLYKQEILINPADFGNFQLKVSMQEYVNNE